jgi:hypothetical protein
MFARARRPKRHNTNVFRAPDSGSVLIVSNSFPRTTVARSARFACDYHNIDVYRTFDDGRWRIVNILCRKYIQCPNITMTMFVGFRFFLSPYVFNFSIAYRHVVEFRLNRSFQTSRIYTSPRHSTQWCGDIYSTLIIIITIIGRQATDACIVLENIAA